MVRNQNSDWLNEKKKSEWEGIEEGEPVSEPTLTIGFGFSLVAIFDVGLFLFFLGGGGGGWHLVYRWFWYQLTSKFWKKKKKTLNNNDKICLLTWQMSIGCYRFFKTWTSVYFVHWASNVFFLSFFFFCIKKFVHEVSCPKQKSEKSNSEPIQAEAETGTLYIRHEWIIERNYRSTCSDSHKVSWLSPPVETQNRNCMAVYAGIKASGFFLSSGWPNSAWTKLKPYYGGGSGACSPTKCVEKSSQILQFYAFWL